MFVSSDPMLSWQTEAQVELTMQHIWDEIVSKGEPMFGNKDNEGRLFDFSSDQKPDDYMKCFAVGIKLIAQDSKGFIKIERPQVSEATRLQAYQDKINQLEKQLRQKS